MPRTATTKKPKDKIEEAIDVATVVEDEAVPVDFTPAEGVAMLPEPTDPGWQDYVLSHFSDADKDPDGNPTAEACRSVVLKLLGPIVAERIRTVQVATPENDYRATVEVSVAIAWGGDRNDIRVFEDVADVYPGNMDPKYAQFPSQSAKTKALGRAFKSALMLKRVYTSEELASKEVPTPGAGFEKLITLSQRRFIEMICGELNIDVTKFINCGERQYNDITQIPSSKADRMIKALNQFQQERGSIPDKIRG